MVDAEMWKTNHVDEHRLALLHFLEQKERKLFLLRARERRDHAVIASGQVAFAHSAAFVFQRGFVFTAERTKVAVAGHGDELGAHGNSVDVDRDDSMNQFTVCAFAQPWLLGRKSGIAVKLQRGAAEDQTVFVISGFWLPFDALPFSVPVIRMFDD